MTEPSSQHASEPLQAPGGTLQLSARLNATQKRRFATMCSEIGVSQQDMIAELIAAALHEYYVTSKLGGGG